ncbi:MAG: hypothetical protein ACREQV_20605, partial [Candidatus Binatia bacterium]
METETVAFVTRLLQTPPEELGSLETAGIPSVRIVEDLLRWRQTATPQTIEDEVRRLRHADNRMRNVATARLIMLPESALDQLRDLEQSADGPEQKRRLKLVLGLLPVAQKPVETFPELLHQSYALHFDELFANRWPRLMRDPHDWGAMAFFGNVSFATVWTRIQDRPPEERLRFLLLRVYFYGDTAGRAGGKEAFEPLQQYTAKVVLNAAAATYWPVEIEPPEKDGTYEWTTRASTVEGNVASQVMRLSIKPADYGNVAERRGWVHFITWYRWIYLFRYPETSNTNVVVFVDTYKSHGSADWHSVPLCETRKRGSARLETMRGIPKSARIPSVTQKQFLDWRSYRWDRLPTNLFPEE